MKLSGACLPRSFVLILLVFLAACQLPARAPDEVATGVADSRAYRHLQLDNGLRVLLVSDSTTDKAAAALDVHVGSRHDPEDRQGLAHFLEHMLFLGTRDYPDPGEYQAFISAHGGSHNAYTAFEHTNYFFDIDAAYLEATLDRFAQFFVAPLFLPEYIEREKHAVHSEFVAQLRNDQRRSLDVFRSQVNPEHPIAGFSVGNLSTLDDRPGRSLRDDTLAFYEEHYAADVMTLVVIGRESLDELEAMVRPRFAGVPEGREPRRPVTKPLWPEGHQPQWVSIEPVQQQRLLSINWPVQDPQPYWRERPLRFIADLLGHEGEGSLLAELRRRGWANGLVAGEGFNYHGGALFGVTVELTEAGVEHAPEVVGLVYQTLALIRDAGLQDWRYREQSAIAWQQFEYREPLPPVREASRLATQMQYYPAREVLSGPFTMGRFVPERIRGFLDELVPERAYLALQAPGIETDRTSPWYQAPYRTEPVPEEWLYGWREASLPVAIRLPERNPYVVQSLAPRPLRDATERPELVMEQPGIRVWHQQDARFPQPRTNVYLALRSPLASTGPEQQVLTELYARMVQDELNEESYPAFLAGLNFDVRRHQRGLTVQLGGFSERQPLLLRRILEVLQQPALDPERFALVRQRYRESLENRIEQPPFRLGMGALSEVLQHGEWPVEDLIQALDAADREALRAHVEGLLAALDLQMLVHGNARRAEAMQLADSVSKRLLAAASPVEPEPLRVTRLPLGEHSWTLPSPHDDAALVLYLQAGELDISHRAALGVSMQLLRADFFNQLRTEQQLGYVVSASAYPVLDVPGAVFVVQSPVASAPQLREAVLAFLADWRERPVDALEADFTRHRRALRQRLAEAPTGLREAGDRLWQEIARGHLDFDSRERLLTAVDDLSFSAWYAGFVDTLELPRALWIYSAGGQGERLDAGAVLDSGAALKAAAEALEFP